MEHRRARLVQRIPALIAALGIFPLLAIVLKRAVDVPFGDEWEWSELIYAAHEHTLTFARLWQPHNEHRIFIPNLLAVGLDALGGWTPVREQLVSVLLLALTQLGLWMLFRRTVPAAWRGAAFLAATVLLLSLVQYENLDWGFQTAWFLCDVCAVAVVVLLTRPHAAARDLAVAAAAATVASLSSSQGLLAWAAGLVAIGLVPRARPIRAAAWAVAGAAVSLLVRFGAPQGDPQAHVGLAHAGVLAEYVLAYLGAPLAMAFGTTASMLAGTAVLVWLIALAAAALRGSLALRLRLAPWVALAGYPVLAAALTAAGRAGFGVWQATSSRYTSIALLAWIAALAGTAIVVRRPPFAIAARLSAPHAQALGGAVVTAAAVLLVLASLKESAVTNRVWQLHAVDLRAARAAIAAGDPSGLSPLTPDADYATDRLGEMGRVRDGVFRRAPGTP
ncbi:MAG TPA: hypothetical protein VHS78_07745 [Candidatus Elarobacter sp.]|nr:hypothetical protein [Candidatus Elarobacter sp.]